MKTIISISMLFCMSGCSTISTGNDAFDAVYSGTAAIFSSKGTADKCEQGHAQDRINCRKRKQTQVDALNKSLKKSSSK
jgi:uncharacterized protein YceK